MSRVTQILNALESTYTTSANEFATLFGVSRRTVTDEVASLQELLSQVASITLVEDHYRPLIVDLPRCRVIRSGLASSTFFNDPTAWASFIVTYLFCATQSVGIEGLAQEMSVGRITVMADLNRVRKHVGEWELEIEGRTHVGLVLRSPKLQQRLLIPQHHYPTAYGHHPSWQRIEQAVAGLTVGAGLDPVHIPELACWAIVAMDRTHRSRPLGILPVRYRELPDTPAHVPAERLTLRPADDGVELAGDEVTFLALPTAGIRASSDSELAINLGNHNEPIEELVERALAAIHAETQIDLMGAPQLTEFTRHLVYMINRMRYQIWVGDSGVASIGQEFPVTHRMAAVAARMIEERAGLPADGSELGFLTAYFQVFLKAVGQNPRLPLRVAIITSTGRVMAELVCLQLSRLLPSATQYLLLLSAVTKDKLAEVDLIATTDDRPASAPVPVLRVSRVLDRHVLVWELDRRHMWLPDSDGGILASVLGEQYSLMLPFGTDYAGAVDYITAHLKARDLAEQGFGERVQEREHLSPTQFSPWVGFPHTTLTTGFGVLLAVGVVPRRPDENGVRLIVPLGVPQNPHRGENVLVSVYDAVLRLGTHRDLLTRISHLTTSEEFYYLFATNLLTES